MISHKHKAIFVEIPKTGSTSVRAMIGFPPKPHLNICQIKHLMESSWTHYSREWDKVLASVYLLLPKKKRSEIGEKQFHLYFKFGFVRNPWDRVVSLYFRNQGLQMKEKMSFTEFVEWIKYSSSTCVHAAPHTNQIDWLVDSSGNVLVDFIGKFENLEKDWEFVASQIGLPTKLPHKNKNKEKRKPYPEYYSKRTEKIIEDKFKVDIEYFEYKFGN